MPGRIPSLFRNLVRKNTVEQALDDESAILSGTHERGEDQGGAFAIGGAAASAHRNRRSRGRVKEEVRAIRFGSSLEGLARDLRLAFRTLAKSPGFTAVAVITLALGIGANTAIFNIVRELVFSPRPYPHEEQVVQFYSQDKKHPEKYRSFSYLTYVDIREDSAVGTAFSGVLAHNTITVGLGEGEGARRAFGAAVSSNYFRTLEAPLAQGRGFLPEEERPGSAVPVVIASYPYWKKTGFDPQLVGKTIRVNERPFTVVGITPEHFTGTMMLFGPELYFPLGDYDLLTNGPQAEAKRSLEKRDFHGLYIVGRVKPGVTTAAAGAVLQNVATNLEKALPVEQKDQTFISAPCRARAPALPFRRARSDGGRHNAVRLGRNRVVHCLPQSRERAACWGLARRKEIAIRLALGGSRGRIMRQLLTEGLVLSLAGGAGGFLIGLLSSDLSAASMSAHMPVTISLRGGTDPAVFVATLGFCALATLFFALGPAFKLTRAGVLADLKGQAGEDSVSRRRRWFPRNPLVIGQVALSLGLLTTAGLFIHGAFKAGSVEIGFNADPTILIETRRPPRWLRPDPDPAALSLGNRPFGRAARGTVRQHRFRRALRSRNDQPSRTTRWSKRPRPILTPRPRLKAWPLMSAGVVSALVSSLRSTSPYSAAALSLKPRLKLLNPHRWRSWTRCSPKSSGPVVTLWASASSGPNPALPRPPVVGAAPWASVTMSRETPRIPNQSRSSESCPPSAGNYFSLQSVARSSCLSRKAFKATFFSKCGWSQTRPQPTLLSLICFATRCARLRQACRFLP